MCGQLDGTVNCVFINDSSSTALQLSCAGNDEHFISVFLSLEKCFMAEGLHSETLQMERRESTDVKSSQVKSPLFI